MPECFATHAMGTRFEIVLESGRSARALADLAFDILSEQHDRLNLFDAGSHIARINREAFTRPVPIDEELLALFERCENLRQATGGVFDIALGGSKLGAEPTHLEPGPRYALDHAAGTIRLCQRGAVIDLGGVAKGFALDLIRDEFLAEGVERAFVHGGRSSGIAIGSPPDRAHWTIRVGDDPDQPLDLQLNDAAFAVSSTLSQIDQAGTGHLVDPVSQQGTACSRAAAVCCEHALDADAWATALALRPGLSKTAPRHAMIEHGSLGGWFGAGGKAEPIATLDFGQCRDARGIEPAALPLALGDSLA